MRLFSGKDIDDEPPPFLNRDGDPKTARLLATTFLLVGASCARDFSHKIQKSINSQPVEIVSLVKTLYGSDSHQQQKKVLSSLIAFPVF